MKIIFQIEDRSLIHFYSFVLNSDIWNLGEYCRSKQLEFQEKGMHNRRLCIPGKLLKKSLDCSDTESPAAKRMKPSNSLDDDPVDLITKNIAFFRAHYSHDELPKTILHTHVLKKRFDPPVFITKQVDKLFRTIVTYNGKKYASSYWEKNKRFAEQGAALVCILDLGLIDEETLIKHGSILK